MPRQRTMKMMRATKPFRYEHRMLTAGETFQVDSRFTRLLLATRKATLVREPAVVPPPPPEVKAKIEAAIATFAPPAAESQPDATPAGSVVDAKSGVTARRDGHSIGAVDTATSGLVADDMNALRAEYFAVLGKQPFRGWDAKTLRDKIASAKSAAP